MRPSSDSSSIPFSLHKKKVLLGRRPRKIPLSHLFQYTRGGLSTATENGIGFTRACLPWALGSSFIPGNHDTPRLTSSLTTRTRGARPSEKIALRVVPGFSPQGHPTLAGPPSEGRAPHAPEECTGLTGACALPATTRSFVHDNHVMPRPPSGPCLRTRRAHPSEKITFRLISGTSPQGHRNSNRPPPGGAGSARPRGMHGLDRGMCPSGHNAFICPR